MSGTQRQKPVYALRRMDEEGRPTYYHETSKSWVPEFYLASFLTQAQIGQVAPYGSETAMRGFDMLPVTYAPKKDSDSVDLN